MRFCVIWIVILMLFNGGAQAAIPRPNIVPQPQVIENSRQTIELGVGARVICPQQAHPILKTAIELVQKRLAELGKASLPVQEADAPAADAGALRIVIGSAPGNPLIAGLTRRLGVQVDAANPGPQGYVIRFGDMDGQPTALLAGSDETGALYACVTLAQMLRREGGRVLIDAADVRDWPDFRRRIIGRPASPSMKLQTATSIQAAGREYGEYVERMRQVVDQCVAFKINALTLRSSGTGKWSNVQSFGPAMRAALREVSDYARERGVILEATAYSAIDVGQGGPAAQVNCVRTHGVGYCWSRDEMLRKQAREFGRFARETGIGLYYLHAPDRTSVGDPANFGERCELCKRRWKDAQRAQADAHVMNIMAEEIKKLSPQTEFCAVLIPYGATLDRLKPEDREAILRYWREASALLPPDMAVCVRENRRPNMAAFKDAFARQPIYFYIESIFWRGWEPFFATTPRHLATFDFDDPRDAYYMGNSPDFKSLSEAMAAHFAWNTDAPGAGEQRAYNHHPLEDGAGPPEVAIELVDRIAARLFGEENATLVGDAVRGDISWAFTADPEAMARAAADRLAGKDSDIPGVEDIEVSALRDLPALMRHQHEGSAAGRRALDQLYERFRSGSWTPTPRQREQLNFMLSYYVSVEALSSVRYPALAAAAANLRGDRAAARTLAEAGLKAADAAPALLARTAEAIGGRDQWHAPARRVAEMVAEDRSNLERQLKIAQGRVPELVDTPENMKRASFLLQEGKVKTRSGGNGDLKFTDQFARTTGCKTLHFTRPKKAWAGCGVQFEPVDIRPFAAQGGFLRFYVNSDGPKGWHRATFWGTFQDAEGKKTSQRPVYLHQPTAEEEKKKGWPGFVDVDDLPDTWQLVSIPLAQFAGEGAAFLSGLNLNFAQVPDCGLVIADPYLIGPAEPVWVEREMSRKN